MTKDTTSMSSSITDEEFIQKLEAAISDLLWFSEAEYPFQVVYWHGVEFNQSTLLQHYNYPPKTKIATQEFPSFFAEATTVETWHNESEEAEVKRYQALVDLIAENLTNIKVYLLGEVEIDAYILGKTKHQAIAGLTTKIVST